MIIRSKNLDKRYAGFHWMFAMYSRSGILEMAETLEIQSAVVFVVP
jgi:hypothetical protein